MIAFVVWANAQRYRGDELNILFCTIVGSFLGAVSGGIIVATKKIIGLSRPPWDSTK